jgi:hypothetical protein
MNYKTLLIAGGAVLASGAAGVAVGFRLAYRKAAFQFDEELKKQIEAAEQLFKMKYKVGMYRSPVEMVESVVASSGQTKVQMDAHKAAYDTRTTSSDPETLRRIISGLRKDEVGMPPGHPISGPPTNGHIPHVEVEENPSILGLTEDLEEATDEVNHNLFGDGDSEWPNYSEYIEENPRTREAPYVITVLEYSTGEENYDQATLVWYDEDEVEGLGVLADLADLPIEDVDMVVGEENMKKFGQWSGSSNTVYIRNERIRTDFEVARTRGSYAEAVGLKNRPKTKRKAARRGADE